MEPISGSPMTPPPAPKGRRFGSAFMDLFIIPIILGIAMGFLFLNRDENVRNLVSVLANLAWLLFRDLIFSPGRAMFRLKLISLSGGKPAIPQALLRNVLLIFPFVMVAGVIIEIIFILRTGNRLADKWAKTQVAAA